mmetsp:Transcript_16947/g.64541  ORF Transcript_16947/g.64541 Transcript_16947/m.64541 type:complete len:200 (+) Transcript_16947:1717-2316(+)
MSLAFVFTLLFAARLPERIDVQDLPLRKGKLRSRRRARRGSQELLGKSKAFREGNLCSQHEELRSLNDVVVLDVGPSLRQHRVAFAKRLGVALDIAAVERFGESAWARQLRQTQGALRRGNQVAGGEAKSQSCRVFTRMISKHHRRQNGKRPSRKSRAPYHPQDPLASRQRFPRAPRKTHSHAEALPPALRQPCRVERT